MNENELKNNTNENNVVTPVEPVVSENTDTASTSKVVQINEPEVATPSVDEAPAVETPVVENVTLSTTNDSPMASIPAAAVPVGESSVTPQSNVSPVAGNAVNVENNNKKSNKVLIIIIVLLGVVLLVVAWFNSKEENSATNSAENNNSEVDKPVEKPNDNTTDNAKLIEDVRILGYTCMMEKCTFSVSLKDEVDYVDYNYSGPNVELLKSLNDYDDYVKVNIYVTGEGENITIVNYELFNKTTNTKIDGVTTEVELRTVLGMYNIGTYTAEFTLIEIGMTGYGFGDNEESYTYRNYEFVDVKGFEYEMKYINPGKELDALVKGNKYTVTFEVTEGTFDYEYTIKAIK